MPLKHGLAGFEAAIFGLEYQPARGAVARDRPTLRHLLYGNKPHIDLIDTAANRVDIIHVRHRAQRPFTSREVE